MSFLQSAQVRAALVEIHELQEVIVADAVKFPDLDIDDQYVHIENLETLLENQRIMYTRLSLSDDPQAKQMKQNIIQGAASMGLPIDVDMSILFSQMGQMVEKMKDSLDIDSNES